MNAATMLSQFKAHTSGLADQMADADILVYINRFYMYILPTEVDGSFSEYEWKYILGTNAYQVEIPPTIVSLNQAKVFIYASPAVETVIRLPVSYDPLKFRTRWPDYEHTTKGMPDECLIYGSDFVTFNRRGDKSYYGEIICRGGPASGLTLSPGVGLEDEIHALAVVHGSAWMYLQEKEDSVGAAREGGLYDIYKNLMLTRSQSRYQPRRPARSY